MVVESRPSALTGLSDDQLGTVAVSLSVSELTWTPDVAPAVMDRISRDAVTYPEQFDRRPRVAGPPPSALEGGRSAQRAVGRLAVFGVILVIILGLVLFAATVSATP